MTDSVIDGLFFYIVTFIVSWIYLLGGLFEYFICQYKLFPTETLKLFDVFGEFHKKVLAVLFIGLGWKFQEEKLLEKLNDASRFGGILWIVLSSMATIVMISNIRHQFLRAPTLFDQVNYGFWLVLMLLTVLWCIRLAAKIMRTHKILKDEMSMYTKNN
jgi:hypothetical protein